MHAGFERSLVWSGRFHHVVYASRRHGDPLLLFIGGDGTPWIQGGTKVASDPTANRPLALELAVHTIWGSVAYLGRPCYLGLSRLPECRPADWTSARYSAAIVASLVNVANRLIRERQAHQVVLVGYSGGGTLAVLMAPHILNLRAVVTIGANLDIAAWTHLHGYLPLTESLDAVEAVALPSTVVEVDFVGARDTNVPPAASARYFAGHPRAQLRIIAGFDHQCCWEQAWSHLLPEVLRAARLTHNGFWGARGAATSK